MGVALYISLEEEIEGISASAVDGKALMKNIDAVDVLAKKLNVLPLMEFYSGSPGQLDGILNEEEIAEIPVNWYAAKEGLKSATALLRNLNALTLTNKDAVQKDLEDLIQVLTAADKAKIRFHFSLDI